MTPVTLGGARTRVATILGKGRTSPSAAGSDLKLRRADLRTLSDTECKHTWGKAR